MAMKIWVFEWRHEVAAETEEEARHRLGTEVFMIGEEASLLDVRDVK